MTPRQFATAMGYKPNYGNQLLKDGRLVLAADGKTVLFDESKARFEATKDPSKQGVADRHAAARVMPPRQSAQAAESEVVDDAIAGSEDGSQYNFQDSKAKREYYAAERERDAYRKESGDLSERSAVLALFSDAGTTLRSKLEAWQTTLPPQLVSRDEAAIRIILADQTERLLLDLVDTFSRWSTASAKTD